MTRTNLTPKMIETIEALRGRSAQLSNNHLNGNTVRALIGRGIIVCEDINGGASFAFTGGYVRITLAAGV